MCSVDDYLLLDLDLARLGCSSMKELICKHYVAPGFLTILT